MAAAARTGEQYQGDETQKGIRGSRCNVRGSFKDARGAADGSWRSGVQGHRRWACLASAAQRTNHDKEKGTSCSSAAMEKAAGRVSRGRWREASSWRQDAPWLRRALGVTTQTQPLRHTAEKGRGRGINTLATHKSFHSVALNHLLSTVCPNCPTGSTQGGGKQGPRMSGSTMTTMDDDDASSSARHPTVIHKKLYKDQAYLIEYEPRAKNTAHREHQPGVQLIQLGQRAGRRVVALSAATRYE